ncbi:hypothetical protein F5H01DRAFT_338841 [Linnemannia elongata]|nr:hypothetical protein F5H01DRAFT_338841 [Linnemannia elongata]
MNKRDIFWAFPSYIGSYPSFFLPSLYYFFSFPSAPLRFLFRYLFLRPFLFYPFYTLLYHFNRFHSICSASML